MDFFLKIPAGGGGGVTWGGPGGGPGGGEAGRVFCSELGIFFWGGVAKYVLSGPKRPPRGMLLLSSIKIEALRVVMLRLRLLCRGSERAIGVHSRNIRSMWNCEWPARVDRVH